MGNDGKGSSRPEALLSVLLIISLLLLIFTGTNSAVKRSGLGNNLLLGIQRFSGLVTERVKDGFGSLKRLKDMRVQYELALERLNDYQGLERNILELKRENIQLKKQLGYSLNIPSENIPVRIIARDPANLFDSLTIDKGSIEGIKPDMVVTSFQNGFFGLLGKVVSVSRHTALVRPVVDPDNFVAARLQESRYQGLVKGRGDSSGELIMQYVRKAARPYIKLNDIVETSGMQSIYPKGIVIGRVKEIRSREYSGSLDLILIPVIDVTKTEYAMVLENGK